MPHQCVLDSSIGVKWLFDEIWHSEAGELLRRIEARKLEVVVPEFFFIEIANACWKRARRKLIQTRDALDIFDGLAKAPLVVYPDRELADVALENALRFNISVYDGIYLALAEIYVAPLVTADEGLLRACRGRFDFIESLRDFQ